LRPLDAFSRLLVGPKRICGPGSALNPVEGAYNGPPNLPAGGEGARCPIRKNLSPAVCLRPQISALQASGVPPKRHGFRESNQNCCKVFRFTEKVEQHWPRKSWKMHINSPGNSRKTISVFCMHPAHRTSGCEFLIEVYPSAWFGLRACSQKILKSYKLWIMT